MNEHICGTCRWHRFDDGFRDWACTNDDSDYCADFTDYAFQCDEYEE